MILCDHASRHVPGELDNLGLAPADLDRHIAWDIGAAGIAENLSELLDSPAILCGTSRLVIDCNRRPDSAELIPAVVHGTVVPGNRGVDAESRRVRIERWFRPYHDAAESILRERAASGARPVVLAIHTMTEILDRQSRPWQIALSSYRDRRLLERVLAALRTPGDLCVGDNEPYRVESRVDYSIPLHALSRGLEHLQVEFRQDLVAEPRSQRDWAIRFARALTAHP